MTPTLTPPQVHVAGPIEATGQQRCLGCNLLLVQKNGDYMNVGEQMIEFYSGETEKWVRSRRAAKALRHTEAFCHNVRRSLDAA